MKEQIKQYKENYIPFTQPPSSSFSPDKSLHDELAEAQNLPSSSKDSIDSSQKKQSSSEKGETSHTKLASILKNPLKISLKENKPSSAGISFPETIPEEEAENIPEKESETNPEKETEPIPDKESETVPEEEFESCSEHSIDNSSSELEVNTSTMAHMDKLKYLPRFSGDKAKDTSPQEHIRLYKDYLNIHEIGGNEWEAKFDLFGYSLTGRARNWYEDYKGKLQGVNITQQVYEDLLKAFKNEFSLAGSTRGEKNDFWEQLGWDSERQNLDDFVRQLEDLADELAKSEEDKCNAYLKAMPGYIVQNILNMESIAEMVKATKRLLSWKRKQTKTSALGAGIPAYSTREEKERDKHEKNVTFSTVDMITKQMDEMSSNFKAIDDSLYQIRNNFDSKLDNNMQQMRREFDNFRRDRDRSRERRYDRTPRNDSRDNRYRYDSGQRRSYSRDRDYSRDRGYSRDRKDYDRRDSDRYRQDQRSRDNSYNRDYDRRSRDRSYERRYDRRDDSRDRSRHYQDLRSDSRDRGYRRTSSSPDRNFQLKSRDASRDRYEKNKQPKVKKYNDRFCDFCRKPHHTVEYCNHLKSLIRQIKDLKDTHNIKHLLEELNLTQEDSDCPYDTSIKDVMLSYSQALNYAHSLN